MLPAAGAREPLIPLLTDRDHSFFTPKVKNKKRTDTSKKERKKTNRHFKGAKADKRMSDRGTRALGANGANDQRSAFKTSLFLIDAKMSVSIYTRATNTPFFLSVVDFKFAVFCFSF